MNIAEELARIGKSAPMDAWDAVPPSDATAASLWADLRKAAAEVERLRDCLAQASIVVWMTLQDALADDADDIGLDGWMREAERRVKARPNVRDEPETTA